MIIDKKYSPYIDTIEKYLSLDHESAHEFAGEIGVLMADDLINESEGHPREHGDAIERGRTLLEFIEDSINQRRLSNESKEEIRS